MGQGSRARAGTTATPPGAGLTCVGASDGGGLTRVTTSPGGGHDVPWDYSPDGRQIVFLRDDLVDEEHDPLMVVNVDGSHEQVLTDRKVGLAASWSPDGTTILTEADGSLLLVPVDGGEDPPPSRWARRARGGEPRRMVARWGNESGSRASAPNSTGEDIYIMRADGTDLHQVTNTPGQDEEFGDWGP